MKFYLLIILLLTSGLPANAQSNRATATSEIITISFCALIQNPDFYHEKEVRFRAKYIANSKVAAFVDMSCTTRENLTWAEFDGVSIKASAEPQIYQKVEEQILCGGCGADKHWRETEMLVTGIFNGGDIGYGRLGKYRFMVMVKNVEDMGETEKTRTPEFRPQ